MGPRALPGAEHQVPAGRRPATCHRTLSQPTVTQFLPSLFLSLAQHASPTPPHLLHPQGINIVPTVTRVDPQTVLRNLEPVNEVEPDSTITVTPPGVTVGNGFTASVAGG